LNQLMQPHEPFPEYGTGRQVTASGGYRASDQVLITDRRLNGASGWWVVSPFALDSGGTVAVVRGFVTDPGTIPAAPAAVTDIIGALASSESAHPAQALPPGQLASLDLAVLVNQWPGEIYNAFVFLQQQSDSVGTVIPP